MEGEATQWGLDKKTMSMYPNEAWGLYKKTMSMYPNEARGLYKKTISMYPNEGQMGFVETHGNHFFIGPTWIKNTCPCDG